MMKKILLLVLAVSIFFAGICVGVLWHSKPEKVETQTPQYEGKNEVFKKDLFDHLDAAYKVAQNPQYEMRLEGQELTDFCQMLSALELTPGDYEIGVDEEGNVLFGGTHQFLMVYQSGATFEFLICRNYLMVSKAIMGFDSLQGKTFAYTPTGEKTLIELVAGYFYEEEM